MSKSKAFLVIFVMLLGIAVVPSGSNNFATQIEASSSVTSATSTSTGTLKVMVTEDTSVVNGSYADMNFGGDPDLYLGTADEGTWTTARTWFKFDLLQLPSEISVQKATLNVFIHDEWDTAGGVDEPVGVYYCANNTWEQMGITWNNQPSFSSTPTSVIDSPASPDMFIEGNWYAWEITPDVRSSLAGNKILSEVLKYTEEWGTQSSFMYPMKASAYPFNATYIEIEYTTPTTSGLTVDGIASGTPLEYINTPCPELGWTFSDPDYQDFQKDYQVQAWNNSYYNDTLLWQKSHEHVYTIHNSYSVSGNTHPFGLAEEFRLQMKFPNTEIPKSGVIDKLYFTTIEDAGLMHLENFEVSLTAVPSTAALTTNFTANLEGRTPTIVLSRSNYDLKAEDHTIELDIEDTFFMNAYLNLIVEIRLTNNTGDLLHLARTSGGPGSVATAHGAGDYYATTADYATDRTYDLKIGYLTQSVYEGDMSSWNSYPFHADEGYPGRFQIKFNQSFVNRAGYIDKIYFRVNELDSTVTYDNLTIRLVETPVLGPLDYLDMDANYGGQMPTVVLDESQYVVRNVGNAVVIDLDNSFYYSNTHDLLIDMQWDDLVDGYVVVSQDLAGTSSYRAWDLHAGFVPRTGQDNYGYDFLIDFVNNEQFTPLKECITLTNSTWYYWRVRTCDSLGIWSDWADHAFKYENITNPELPVLSGLTIDSAPVEVGTAVTVSIDATHSLGIYRAYIEFDGVNHTMTANGDTFFYTWTPDTAGQLDFTVYVHSNTNTWASVSDSFDVITPTTTTTGTTTGTGIPIDTTTLLIIVGVVAVVIVIIVVVMKKKK